MVVIRPPNQSTGANEAIHSPHDAHTLLPLDQGPRVICYHQTHHRPNGEHVSLLPLIINTTGVTHVIIAAIHLNEGPDNITLNDDPPDSPRYNTLWSEVAWLQGARIKVLGMLGGAAKGSYERLSGDAASFEAYYRPLSSLIRTRNLQGLDLDVEEPIPLSSITRLIHRLRTDFGPSFLITLAPVCTALLPAALLDPKLNISGFSYHALHWSPAGPLVNWYNCQFYCGWGDLSTTEIYDMIISSGWPVDKIVVGTVTNPANGQGFVDWAVLSRVLGEMRRRYGDGFGGVMGWEYFNSLGPGVRPQYGNERPWEWAGEVGRAVRTRIHASGAPSGGFVGGFSGQVRQSQQQNMPLVRPPASTWSEEAVGQLVALGFTRQQACAALNAANGNVEYAAGLLFQDL